MVKIKVDEDACVGCGSCVEDCPNDVYELDSEHGKTVVVKEEDCMACLIMPRDMSCPITRTRRYTRS